MRVTARFLTSAASPRQFIAPGPPEIAFLGRSNVGKSSLLNSLIGSKVAHVSSTPGRTRTINFFAIHTNPDKPAELVFADLPGYGYAKLPRAVTARWPEFIEPYLRERPTLALCVVLVDANVPVQESDRQLLEWLRGHGRESAVVATKSDKLSGNKLRNALRGLEQELGAEPIPYSVKTGVGRAELWRRIRAFA